jgi:hypothetical protein
MAHRKRHLPPCWRVILVRFRQVGTMEVERADEIARHLYRAGCRAALFHE